MKTSISILLATLCLLQLICRGQSFFDNYYKTGYHNNQSISVMTEMDSGFVFVNYIVDSATYRSDLGLIRLDKQGNAVINRSFNMFNGGCGYSYWGMKNFIEATPSSYFLLTGYSTGNSQGFLVTKLNKSTLDTLKTIIHTDAYSYGINNFIKFNNNKYYLVGNRWIGNTQSSVIFRLDSNLIILDTIIIPTPADFGIWNATYNPINKKILLAGGRASGQYLNTFFYVDTLGTISKTTYGAKYMDHAIPQMLFSPSDSSYIGIGHIKTGVFNNFNMYKLWIGKYDINLYPKWERTYGDAMPGNGLLDAVLLNDGSIAVTGGYSPLTTAPLGNANMNGIILKVNEKGQFQWAREYDHVPPGSIGNMVEQFCGIDKTLDKGLIVCGSIIASPSNKSKAWAVKTDSSGCVFPGCTASTLQLDSVFFLPPPIDTNTVDIKENDFVTDNISIYPNPVNNILSVKLTFLNPTTEKKEYHLVIINNLGQTVLNSKIRTTFAELDVKLLKDGIYFLHLFTENQLLASKKFIKD